MSERQAPGIASGLVHAAVTIALAGAIGRFFFENGPYSISATEGGVAGMVLVGFASVAVWQWRRRQATSGLTTAQMLAAREAELERREADVDAVHARLAELEERLDFSERMLAQGRSPEPQRGEGPR